MSEMEQAHARDYALQRRCDEVRAWLDQMLDWNERADVGLAPSTVEALAAASVKLAGESAAIVRRWD